MRGVVYLLIAMMWAGAGAGWSARASAQAADADKHQASSYKPLIEEALREFEAGRFPEARALFLRAHKLQPSARTERGLGIVEFELRHYGESIRQLEQALADKRNPLVDPQRREVGNLIRRAASFVGRYRVLCIPTDAALIADGASLPCAQSSGIALDVGEHSLVVRAEGFVDERRRLDVRGGEDESLVIELKRANTVDAAPAAHDTQEQQIAPPIEPKPLVLVAAATAQEVQPAAAPVHATRSEKPTLARASTWGWVALGGSALAFGGAGVALLLRNAAATRWNSDTCLAHELTRLQNCAEHQQAARTAQTWQTMGLIGGGVLGVGALALLLVGGSSSQPSEHAWRCDSGPGELGVACAVGF